MDPNAIREVERVPHGGDSDPTILDFSTNVNPEVPDGVEGVYRDAFDPSRAYPDDGYPDFRAAAGAYVGCDPERVVPTPGGLAAIRLAIQTTVAPGDSVLVPYPSFGEYAREVRLQGGVPVFVAHDEILDAEPADHEMVIVCNPNNPTGETYEPDELRTFAGACRDTETTLLVDEAFLGFTDRPSLAGDDSVVVARSLTKLFGLPGLRAGFAVAREDRLDALATARRAWNLGTPAARVGTYCMCQESFVVATRKRVASERNRMREALSGRFDVAPSDAPFLLCDVGERDPQQVVALAREQGIAIRDATTFRGLDSHIRVAVRTPEENDRLLEVLADV